MDRAARNFSALAAVVLVLAGYGLCAFVAYGILPLLDGRTQGVGPALLVPAGLGTLLCVSAVRGVRALWREGVAARALRRHIEAAASPSPPHLLRTADEAGLSGQVTLIYSPECRSFVYGALAPRVALSSGLLSRLSTDELRAALAHERYHVQSLDPLRSVVTVAATDAAFFLPALRLLRRRYETGRELAADRRAVELVGARPLAGALLKAVEGGGTEHPATIPLAAPRLIDSRLAQLETGIEPTPATIGLGVITTTILGALAFLILLAAAPLAAGGSADLARELGPIGLLEGATVCLLPLAGTAATLYWSTSVRSARSHDVRTASP
jgi:Zn-dependent protease with chaperone function